MLCGTLTGRGPMGRYDILRRIERLDARIRRGWPEATRAGAAILPTAPAAALLHAATPANVSQRLCHRGAANGDYRLATKLMPRMALHTTMRPTRPPMPPLIATSGMPNSSEQMASDRRWPESSVLGRRGS